MSKQYWCSIRQHQSFLCRSCNLQEVRHLYIATIALFIFIFLRYGLGFPQLTPRDIARAHALLMNHLHVPSLHAVIGASLGGMVALNFAAEYPQLVQRLCAISGTGRSSPGSVALRAVQRHAILSDPNYQA
jgi:pimeloyl-ACP methyl ester carboxylesterase